MDVVNASAVAGAEDIDGALVRDGALDDGVEIGEDVRRAALGSVLVVDDLAGIPLEEAGRGADEVETVGVGARLSGGEALGQRSELLSDWVREVLDDPGDEGTLVDVVGGPHIDGSPVSYTHLTLPTKRIV